MSKIDYEELERESYPSSPENFRKLTPELLGQIVAYSWQVMSPNEINNESDDIDTDIFLELFLDHRALPVTIAKILHIDRRLDGDHIVEATEMFHGMQISGGVGRMNPHNMIPLFKTDTVQASHILAQLEIRYPKEVSWVKQKLNEKWKGKAK